MDIWYNYILLSFGIAATVPFVLANGVVFAHRKRSYFRAQGGVSLILGSSIAGLVCVAALFVNNGEFNKVGPFRSCALWIFWLQGVGAGFWFLLIILRLRRLYEISHNLESGCWKYIFVILPFIVMASVATSGHFDREKENGRRYCALDRGWFITVVLVYTGYWLLLVVFMYKMRAKRNDTHLAREYAHTFEYIVMATVVVSLNGVAAVTGASQSVSGRCFSTFSTGCLIFCYFWIRFGWPVYLCLFRPKEEMDRLEQELSSRAPDAMYFQSMHFPCSEGAIWEAFSEAREDLERYKDQIQKLQEHKLDLQEKIRELQMKKSSL